LLTVRTFQRRFPEFRDTDVGIIQARIDEAHVRVDESVWGDDRAATAIAWLAAHMIATSPVGEQARIADEDGKTRYLKEFNRMKYEVTSGFRVI
jgi:hypothetical protein